MKILLIGANSYVGARLYLDLKEDHAITGTFSTHQLSKEFIHLDITNSEEIQSVLHANDPDIVIHCANNANAKWCDEHPTEAVELNQTSTQKIADAVKDRHAKCIYISSMSVFDQSNMYGKTKLASEKIIQDTLSDYLILRPWLILGFSPNTANDRPFNRILKNLDEKNSATYDATWKFQPTYLHHISKVIQHCLARNIWNTVIPIATPETSTRYQTAYDILTPFGIEVRPIDMNKTESYTNPLTELTLLHLPTYSYKEMITAIIDEIRDRSRFSLQ